MSLTPILTREILGEMDNQIPAAAETQSPAPSETPEQLTKPYGRNWKKLIFIYLIIASVLYIGIYYFVLSKQSSKQNSQPVTKIVSPSQAPDPTADWKTYTNEKIQLYFSYPQDWVLNEEDYPDSIQRLYLNKSDNPRNHDPLIFIDITSSPVASAVDNMKNSHTSDVLFIKSENKKQIGNNTWTVVSWGNKLLDGKGGTYYITSTNNKTYTLSCNYPDENGEICSQILQTFKFTK